ncbi:MAG: cryptochrome/photolyase family protein [Crocinitomix sp.]|nr:cryptochrome/photolyase family protein [Crocinitomix sp.]
MTTTVQLCFPHQLFKSNAEKLLKDYPVYLIEEYLFFNQYKFHKQKITFHRASMKYHSDYLEGQGFKVIYIEAHSAISDIRFLIKKLKEQGVKDIRYIDPTDFLLHKRIKQKAAEHSIELTFCDNPLFLNKTVDLSSFFRPDKKKFFQTSWYKSERQKRNILIYENGNPEGGDWSYDADNRKKYPKKKIAPPVQFPSNNAYYHEAINYTEKQYPNNFGTISKTPLYPISYLESESWLKQFLEQRFHEFGTYEDAIVAQESILNHSVLSPMLNIGLLTPKDILDAAILFAKENEVPINSTEGFVRQIIGWREFIRGMYEVKGVEMRTKNYWGFKRKIPTSFYEGTTGIPPIDITIKRVLRDGYCHHIERLMVLGNFMLLCEFDPKVVYQWFMELFVDAYDWVMVPNVYGMSQFADGGLFATKPYISGSNYLIKMSDYPKGDWQPVWDGLFWRFMHVHRDFFSGNPRLGMLVRNLDKMGVDKLGAHLNVADNFLDELDKS